MACAGDARLHPRWWSSRYHVLAGLRHALDQAFNSYVHPGVAVLDYGCGDRPYEALITDRGGAYLGADLRGVPGIDRTIDHHGRVDAIDGSVDVILSTQVLEHVPDPRAYLAEVRRLLKDDGVLILSTHGYWRYHPHPQDLWRWTGPGLRAEIGRAGFEVVSTRGVLNLGAAGIQLFQDFLSARLPSHLATLSAVVLQRFVGIVDAATRRTPQDEAAVFVVVASCLPREAT